MEEKTAAIGKSLSIGVYILWSASFLIPFAVSGPQLATGSIVNCLLFISARNLNWKALLPVAILPSIGALAHGAVFGPATPFLLFFLPFIWFGNIVLIWTFKNIKVFDIAKVFLAAGIKSAFLFLLANLYFNFHLVPKLFITSMGMFQFYTAIIGGVLALVVLSLIKKNAN
ncbi:hypothetical protein C4559_01565 [Candidatus Microgenomates bacterium]|nr:MAG: hypothetical protein C4559_01565 [Candidatus Microgenomates bacterium]